MFKVTPKVYFPKEKDLLILEIDACDEFWGVVLKAIPKNFKQEEICGYGSGKFKPNE